MIQTRRASDAFTEFNRAAVIAVGVPLMIAGGRRHVLQQPGVGGAAESGSGRQPADRDDEQAGAVRVPARRRRRRPFLPLAIILYWFANNIWTFGQQHYVFGKIEKEEEAKKLEAIERRAANAPPAGRQAEGRTHAEGEDRCRATAPQPDGYEVTESRRDELTRWRIRRRRSGAKPEARGNRNRPGTPRPGARPKKRKR